MAAELRLSPRYVQKLLKEANTTFAEVVMQARLRRAHDMLGDRASQHLTIHEIASTCGFAYITTFNRRFRDAFNLSPGEARAARSRR